MSGEVDEAAPRTTVPGAGTEREREREGITSHATTAEDTRTVWASLPLPLRGSIHPETPTSSGERRPFLAETAGPGTNAITITSESSHGRGFVAGHKRRGPSHSPYPVHAPRLDFP